MENKAREDEKLEEVVEPSPVKKRRRAPVRKKHDGPCRSKAELDLTEGSQIDSANLEQNESDPSKKTGSLVKKDNSEEIKPERSTCEKCYYCNEHSEPIKEPKKRFDCKACKDEGVRRTFASSEKLDIHIKKEHDTEESKLLFWCRECKPPNLFLSKAKYLYHLGSKHPGLIHFVCELCAKIFKLKANYKAHMVEHNIQPKKQFSCDICKGTFVNRAGLESHMRRFPGPHMKQICAHCGFSFSRERHMQNHRCKKLLLEEAANRMAELEATEAQQALLEEQKEVELPQIYRQIHVGVDEPVVIQELTESSESEQIIIGELTRQIVPNNHVLHFDVSDGIENGQVFHVNVADWNITPYMIRDHTTIERATQ